MLCAAPSITFKVLFPAPIDVPQHIQRIGLIDRSVPDNNILSIIEGGLTGEGIGQDKLGTQFALDGLNGMLQNSPRFHVYRTTEAMIGGSPIGASFPDPLPWGKIEELCHDYDVDAIISLEKYDSDFIVTNASKDVKKKNADGQEIRGLQRFVLASGCMIPGTRAFLTSIFIRIIIHGRPVVVRPRLP